MPKTDRFDEAAATWDEEPRRVELARAVAGEVTRRVRPSPDVDVLDFGCGTGLLTLALQPLVRRVTGTDTSSGMLGVLRQKIEARGIANVDTVLLDPEATIAPEARVHLIVSSMALHHVADLAGLFRRLHGTLRAGGQIALADLDREDGSFHEDTRGVFHLGFERSDVLSLLTEAGFTGLEAATAAITRKGSREYPVFLITGQRAG
jgi:tRNA (cmo5U34)-methyltransferase